MGRATIRCIDHCPSVMLLSADWQREHPAPLFRLLMKALRSIDFSIDPTHMSDCLSHDHLLNLASFSPNLQFTCLVWMSSVWLPGRMMKRDGWEKSGGYCLPWLQCGFYCSQLWSALIKSVLAVPRDLLNFSVSGYGFQVDLFHSLPTGWGEADSPLVSRFLPLWKKSLLRSSRREYPLIPETF